MKNEFTSNINDNPIEKPLNIRLYDETKYHDDHIKNMVTMLSFRTSSMVKFKIVCFDLVRMSYDMV